MPDEELAERLRQANCKGRGSGWQQMSNGES